MTGNLTLAKTSPLIFLNATGSNDAAQYTFGNGGLLRWSMRMTGVAESSGNVGSDFEIARYDDAGTQIDTPLTFNRATGTATFNKPASIPGVTDAGNAAAGNIGEQLSAQITTAVNLTLNTPANIGSLTLTPGDWAVAGNVNFVSPATAGTRYAVAISLTANTLPTPALLAAGTGTLFDQSLTYGKAAQNFNTSLCRVNVSVNTTVYLVALGPTTTATGYISARRVR
jgi:hypothetical protein